MDFDNWSSTSEFPETDDFPDNQLGFPGLADDDLINQEQDLPQDQDFFRQDADIISAPPPPMPQLNPPAGSNPPRRTRRLPPPPPPPPFAAPYDDATYQPFSSMREAKDYANHLNNKNDAYVAIPLAFIHRIRDDPRKSAIYGFVIHHS